eukprot:CAMPEP_0119125522 /NCGR_PEP_ID=MMETSP1310-20130426/4763_1 /TAXON_ID=464262 /ORGANISM="Genus nov. species nov., Strain RCC2339" /LENGTH=127 /DNA_ID=CAMNT_0007115597 /DNA_START=222 /DNA_END=605 /DNA_ORIENTATION=-
MVEGPCEFRNDIIFVNFTTADQREYSITFLDDPSPFQATCSEPKFVFFDHPDKGTSMLAVQNVSSLTTFSSFENWKTYKDLAPCEYVNSDNYSIEEYSWTYEIDGEYLACRSEFPQFQSIYAIRTDI